jgi:hypothetical protein
MIDNIKKLGPNDSDDSFSIGESDEEGSEIKRVDAFLSEKRNDDDEVDDFLAVLKTLKCEPKEKKEAGYCTFYDDEIFRVQNLRKTLLAKKQLIINQN